MSNFKNLKLILLFFISIPFSTNGQDTQYWSKQYGTYGSLLGGTVIGAISDLSATYYNPGAIAFSKDSTLLLTTNSYQFIYLNFQDVVQTDLILDSWYSNASKGIFAVQLPFNWLGDDKLIVSYIARNDFTFNSAGNSFTPYYNEQYTSKFLELNYSIFESWFGITWSNPLSDNVGFGVTMYVPYRSHRVLTNSLNLDYKDDEGNNKSLIMTTDYDFYNLRLLWKAGVSIELGKVMLGLSLTTPSINLFGSGSVYALFVKSNIDTLQNVPDYANNYQEGLSTTYKSPISIGFGAAYYWKRTVLYFSAEWFNKVNPFPIMEPKDFIAQSSGEIYIYNLNYSLKSVFNFGFGIKYTISKNFTYYGGITTDRTAFDPTNLNPFVLSTWDVMHLRSGAEFKFFNLRLTLGLSYGYSGDLLRNFNFLGLFKNNETDVIYHQIDVIFGFSYSM